MASTEEKEEWWEFFISKKTLYKRKYASRLITQLLNDYGLLEISTNASSKEQFKEVLDEIKEKHKDFTATTDDAYRLEHMILYKMPEKQLPLRAREIANRYKEADEGRSDYTFLGYFYDASRAGTSIEANNKEQEGTETDSKDRQTDSKDRQTDSDSKRFYDILRERMLQLNRETHTLIVNREERAFRRTQVSGLNLTLGIIVLCCIWLLSQYANSCRQALEVIMVGILGASLSLEGRIITTSGDGQLWAAGLQKFTSRLNLVLSAYISGAIGALIILAFLQSGPATILVGTTGTSGGIVPKFTMNTTVSSSMATVTSTEGTIRLVNNADTMRVSVKVPVPTTNTMRVSVEVPVPTTNTMRVSSTCAECQPKGNILDFMNRNVEREGSSAALLFLFCFLAGFSERLVPDMLERIAGKFAPPVQRK
jgi:hypothetical protein